MRPDVQLIAVWVMVGVSVTYVLRATWRTWFGAKAGCASGCGNCAAPVETKTEGRFPLPQI